jgi:hypothetical protein
MYWLRQKMLVLALEKEVLNHLLKEDTELNVLGRTKLRRANVRGDCFARKKETETGSAVRHRGD